jgi:xylan 1,4-beta-xylosidase
VDYTPTCLAGNVGAGQDPNRNPPDIGANQLKWDQLVEEMALHEIEAENVTTFEVWNEPNLLFWNGTPEQYYALYVDTAMALETAAEIAHRTIEVGGPAPATIIPTSDMTWMDNFLSYVNQHQAPLDFLSWHA